MAKKIGGLGKGLSAIFSENDTEDMNEIVSLKISQIEPNRNQPRRSFDEDALQELADSISEHGVLQPILVRQLEDGRYQIIAGERRFRAAKLAALTEIPALVMETDDQTASQLAIIENIQRENLNPLEEAMAYRSLAEEFGMTQEEISAKIGKSRSAIANFTRLLDLPDGVQALVAEGLLSAGHARALLGLRSKEDMEVLGLRAAEQGWSVRMMEDEVRKWNRRISKPEEVEEKKGLRVDYVAELERRMMANLGRRVKIATEGKKKSVTLFFEDNEDLDNLLRHLCGDSFLSEI